jgi:predicted nucleic acid-binding protein
VKSLRSGNWVSDGVKLVIADTSPINYLLLIGHIDILPVLFDKMILPAPVWDELKHPKAPPVVRNWVNAPPPWVDVRPTGPIRDASLERLDSGESAAIALAIEIHADLVLMDDDEGVIVARGKGLAVTGTLGVLSRAAERDLLNLADAFDRLKKTNFRFRQEIMDKFLDEMSGREC